MEESLSIQTLKLVDWNPCNQFSFLAHVILTCPKATYRTSVMSYMALLPGKMMEAVAVRVVAVLQEHGSMHRGMGGCTVGIRADPTI